MSSRLAALRELEERAARFLAARGIQKVTAQVRSKKARRWSSEETRSHARTEPENNEIVVKYDLLRWMLERKMIERWHYYAGRRFQGLYLSSLIGPPICRLSITGFGRSGAHGGSARADITYPGESQFSSIKKLSLIEERLRPRSVRGLRTILCRYSLEEVEQMASMRPLIHRHHHLVRGLLQELAWAMGYTTENPYAEKRAA